MPHDPPPPHCDPAPENQPEHPAPHVAPIQTGGPLRRVLPWGLSAAAVLGLLLIMLFVVLPRLSQVPRHSRNSSLPSDSAALPSAADPALPPPVPAQPPAAAAPVAAGAAVPLAVTLYSTGSGKHISAGKPVLISAYASLPPAGSATIAISYTHNGGPRSLLTLAQGSLSTASWTPALPGHYDFTASALDSRKISAFSRHIAIDVDAPLAPAGPLPVVMSPAPPGKIATPTPRAAEPAAHRIAARIVPLKPAAPKHPLAPASHSMPYHVAAAAFVVRPVAETLAGALRRQGFHAFVRVTTQPHHKPTFVVETGEFLRPADAKKQLYTLNHDGYPAFISR